MPLNEKDPHFIRRVYTGLLWDVGRPAPSATVTIFLILRLGEYTTTETDGVYIFPHVQGDALDIRVENKGYESKEVAVL